MAEAASKPLSDDDIILSELFEDRVSSSDNSDNDSELSDDEYEPKKVRKNCLQFM